MQPQVSVFKPWVPEWLIRLTVFMVLLPGVFLLGLYAANITEAAGYYGIEPADVQFSIVMYYAALAAFFPFENRFFSFLATRHFFLIGVLALTALNTVLYLSHNPAVFISLRFLEGIFASGVVGTCTSVIFTRLPSERSRAMGYSIFYGVLLTSSPLSMMMAAWVLQYYEFNALFKLLLYLQIPGAIILMVIMNDVRLKHRIPLYQLEWVSYIFYTLVLSLVGYVLVYGQQLNWLEDPHIRVCVGAMVVLLVLFVLRQVTIKRPAMNLAVFKFQNFRVGILLMFLLYISRGSLGITTSFFNTVLGLDPIHISYLMLANLAGLIIGLIITPRFILQQTPMRGLWICGFAFLLGFHGWMFFHFTATANLSAFILPLVLQGLGSGMLLVSIVVFTVSSVPAALSNSASATGVAFRFLGFTSSMSLINFFQLYDRNVHYSSFQQAVTLTNPLTAERLAGYTQVLLKGGLGKEQASLGASKLLGTAVAKQAGLLYFMDYYALISGVLILVIMGIALVPYINKTIVNFKRKPIPF